MTITSRTTVASPLPPRVFLDFDGTITRRDAIDAILEAFADPSWKTIESAWASGQIGSRECLSAQMALVRATPAALDALLDDIALDPGLLTLLDQCAAASAPVAILSDGFDYCIKRILSRPSLKLGARLTGVPIVSSHLAWRDGRWLTSFEDDASCRHGCATCKPGAMARMNADGRPTLFVGDGLSDRFAAAVADVVMAKDGLADHCRARAIPFVRYDHLDEVAGWLADQRGAERSGEGGRSATGVS
jgi:2,3-diketo-5-methylthio-1-phosphopentane phosphatase